MTTLTFTFRLFTALLFGASIGIERQWMQKSAGLRTNTLVAMGAAAFVLLSIKIGGDATGRIASYVVSGIGFLGAGVIMKDGLSVRGLNTAATIWCSAAVGCLCGLGITMEAFIVSAFVIISHIALRPIGIKLSQVPISKEANIRTDYLFTIKCKNEVENHLRVLLMQYLGNEDKILLKSLTSDDNGIPENAIITAEIFANSPQDAILEKVASRLTIEDKVIMVGWEIIGAENDI